MILGQQEISILLWPYAVCFSVIKSCTYWDSSTLQALHEHACLFLIYEKCNVDRVGKMPSNKTVSSDLKSFLSLIVNYVSISLHRRGGRGCERLTIFMQSRVPLGPGKFHVVVLVGYISPNKIFTGKQNDCVEVKNV